MNRQLDALIAERVLGWTVKWRERHGPGIVTERFVTPDGRHLHPDNLPSYSDDMNAALEGAGDGEMG